MFFEQKITNIFKSSGWGPKKSELPKRTQYFITIEVFLIELIAYHISFVYFTHFSNLHISGTNIKE